MSLLNDPKSNLGKIIVSALFLSSCSEPESNKSLDCSSIKNGKFEYRNEFSNTPVIIERNDSIQVETNESTGLTMKLKVGWLDNCKYQLTLVSFVADGKDSLVDPSSFPPIKTEVVKVTKNYYVCQSKMEGRNNRIDTMLILK